MAATWFEASYSTAVGLPADVTVSESHGPVVTVSTAPLPERGWNVSVYSAVTAGHDVGPVGAAGSPVSMPARRSATAGELKVREIVCGFGL